VSLDAVADLLAAQGPGAPGAEKPCRQVHCSGAIGAVRAKCSC